MEQIELSQGKVALIDTEDYDLVIKYKWYANKQGKCFYAIVHNGSVENKRIFLKMHRVIMGITDSKIFVDHIDGDGLNNQKNNLRLANISQNATNKSSYRGVSKYKGVSQDTRNGKKYWKATCTKNGITYRKRCKTETEAALKYNELAKKLHGEFAKFNKIEEQL